jgi:hypothetical protein
VGVGVRVGVRVGVGVSVSVAVGVAVAVAFGVEMRVGVVVGFAPLAPQPVRKLSKMISINRRFMSLFSSFLQQ